MIKRLLFIAAFLSLFGAQAMASDPIYFAPHSPLLLPVSVSASGCGSVIISSDTFTEASTGNISLEAHTSNSGDSWVGINGAFGTNGLSLDRTGDVILSTAAGANGAGAYVGEAVTCADVSVQMTARTGGTGTNRIGPKLYDPATGNGYWLRATGAGNIELLTLLAGGSDQQLCTGSIATLTGVAFGTATNYTLFLQRKANVLDATINGVSVCSGVSNSANPGNLQPGFKITNTAPRGDNFTAAYVP